MNIKDFTPLIRLLKALERLPCVPNLSTRRLKFLDIRDRKSEHQSMSEIPHVLEGTTWHRMWAASMRGELLLAYHQQESRGLDPIAMRS